MKNIDLNKLDRNQPFKAPDRYFEELPSVIQSKAIESNRKAETWKLPIIKWAAVPAIIVAVLIFLILPKNENKNAEQILSEVSTEELVAYLESSEMSTAELLDLINEPNSLFDETDILSEDLTDDDFNQLIDIYDVLL